MALGLACMILSLAIVTGFQMAIRDKVVGFGSHIQVTRFDNNLSFELQPISARQDFVAAVKNDPDILNIQVFATKPGIIKTKDQIEGIVLKGIGADYNWSFFASRVVEGHTITVRPDTVTDEVMISRETANRLYLKA
ncbi:MAG: ABC transporter permease, partial [Bacteroidetes bacterium]|nr:ABC transporter permease [Bacteroidota bacterium]